MLKANDLQDLADVVPELLKATAGHELAFSLKVGLKADERPKDEVVQAINAMLKGIGGGIEVE